VLNRYLRVLLWIGAGYILWLAWHIYRSDDAGAAGDAVGEGNVRHCSFLTGLFVPLTNAKIIIFCMTALTTFVLPYAKSWFDVLKVAVFLPFTGPMANLVWLYAGASLQKFFRNYRKSVNTVMALSLVLCAVNILLS